MDALKQFLESSPSLCWPYPLVEAQSCTTALIFSQPFSDDLRFRKVGEGRTGSYYKELLRNSGFSLSSLYTTSVVKEIGGIEKYVKAPKTRRDSPRWETLGNSHLEVFKTEIQALPTKLLFAVGDLALCALTGRWGIHKWRGSLLSCAFDQSKYVIPLLSAESLYAGSPEDMHLILCDLKKAFQYRERNFQLTQRHVVSKPSFEEAIYWLDLCYAKGMEGATVAFDIEIQMLELNCISFSIEPESAISIPFKYAGSNYWTPRQESEIMLKIARILSSPSIRKLGQNLIFDTHFMLRKYGIRSCNFDDTMVAQHALLPQVPKGLDMITSLWTDIPYYKDEGKEWFSGRGTYEQLWQYNGFDSIACMESLSKILQDVSKIDNIPAYERQLSIILPCTYMMERGISVDMEGLKAERRAMEEEVKFKRQRLTELAPGLNPQSPKQLFDYFYVQKKFPYYKNKQGKVTTDASAMKKIGRQKGRDGAEVARLITEIKKQEKLIATYMADLKFDSDNRIRCSYNPCGTSFSRLSSSKSIFGSGMNMQNWPHRSLRHLKPDTGYVYYGIDLSQAENRIVAYVGRVENMIKAFEEWQDVHRLTASLIFNKKPDEVSDEPGSSSLGTGEFSERDWGKKANHGLNYGFGYKAFALLYEMPEAEAKRICDGYHSAYPGIRKGFHSYVEECLCKNRIVPNLMGRKVLLLGEITSSLLQSAYSSIPQGTVGDIINERGLSFLYYQKRYKEVEILQQVHDSIGIQIPLSLSWTEHAAILWELKESLETPVYTQYGRPFTIPADIVMGTSLHKESGIEFKAKKFPQSVELFAAGLEEAWDKLLSK